MDVIVLLLFVFFLIGSILLHIPILFALAAGFLLFFLYSLKKAIPSAQSRKPVWKES